MRHWIACLVVPALLAGCGAEPVWAPEEAVERAAYRDTENPPSITLFTVLNNRSGEGAHSALMINASQRVIFDPAGTWWHRTAPERNDLHYGITPTMLKFYTDYHARETFHVDIQTLEVSPEVAEAALQIAEEYGAVPKAFCGRSTSDILRRLPGFETVPRSIFPRSIMRGFAKIDGVERHQVYDDDSDDNGTVLVAQQTAAPAQPAK
jgi:hypothetical protein